MKEGDRKLCTLYLPKELVEEYERLLENRKLVEGLREDSGRKNAGKMELFRQALRIALPELQKRVN